MYNVAVVGATGMVGRKMLEILEEYNFPVKSLSLFASARSAGEKVSWKNKDYTVETLNENSFDRPLDFAFFSAGGEISTTFAPIAEANGVIVIDNSSAWRMDPRIALIVTDFPEPDSPTIASVSPFIKSKLTSRTA